MSYFLTREYLHKFYFSCLVSHLIYSKCILFKVSKSLKKDIQNVINHSGAIINNCLLKYVIGDSFDLDFLLSVYLKKYIISILSHKHSICLKSFFIPNKSTRSCNMIVSHSSTLCHNIFMFWCSSFYNMQAANFKSKGRKLITSGLAIEC